MRLKFLTSILILLLSAPYTFAQNAGIKAGPMLGAIEMRSAKIWLQTTGEANVQIKYTPTSDKAVAQHSETRQTTQIDGFTCTFDLALLEPATKYNYEILINGQPISVNVPATFTTQPLWQWRNDPPAIKIALGSCAYVGEPVYDRPGKPYGGDYQIFTEIAKAKPDVMLWLGDNYYYREADWFSRAGMIHRASHTRALPEMQQLLATAVNIAIWDDHDYGPNNSDKSWVRKEDALDIFELFWANPTYGFSDMPGITTFYQYGDVEFFMLDNRYHRTANFRRTGKAEIIGAKQMEWLLNALAGSYAPFKFIVIGGQVLNSSPGSENYMRFAEERNKLLQAIENENIEGVFFLTGDRHFSELAKLKRYKNYPIYELTVSPLTSGAYAGAKKEKNNYRIDETVVTERNFGILEVTGKRKNRTLTIRIYDNSGKQKWERSINEKELKR
jgi:alkaline phosphatase D